MPANPSRFAGLLTNVDGKDVPPQYSLVQDNIGNYRPGRLDVRKGMKSLTTAWGSDALGSVNLIAAFSFLSTHARWGVFQSLDGTIYPARNGRTTALSLITGLNIFQPACFVQDQFSRLIEVNGIDRGYFWKGSDSAVAVVLGITPPPTSPGCAVVANYNSGLTDPTGPNAGSDYWLGYRYIDGDNTYSSMSGLTKVSVAALDGDDEVNEVTFNWDSTTGGIITGTAQARVTYIELWRTVANNPEILYKVTSIANSGGTSYSYTDTKTDATLLDLGPDDILAVTTQGKYVNARRFVAPPTNKPYVALFQDSLWFYGRVFYNQGTVALTSGSPNATITGGTLTAGMLVNGWQLRVYSATAVYEFTVTGVNVGGQYFTLSANSGVTISGASYVATPFPSQQAYLAYYSVKGEPESVPETNALRIQSSAAANDYETGLMPLGPYLYFLHENHYYLMSYCCSPREDASISPAYDRGCVNNRCWIIVEGTAYMLDQLGAHACSGGSGPSDLTTKILRDYFESTIDWSETSRKWFFASYDPHQRIIRWHVKHTGDSGTRPKRAICLSLVGGEWWTESYPIELGGACIIEVSGKRRLVCAGVSGGFMLMNEGYADLIATGVKGTVTSASSGTSVTDSAGAFAAAMVGAPIYFVQGTGKDQLRTITAVNSTTNITVSAAVTVSTDSVYLVGGVKWTYRTPHFYLMAVNGGPSDSLARNELQVEHAPTASASLYTVRTYRNRLSSVDTVTQPGSDASGFIKGVVGTGDIEVRMESARGQAGQAIDPGFTTIPYNGLASSSNRVSGDRYIQFEIEGYQAVNAIQLLDVLASNVQR